MNWTDEMLVRFAKVTNTGAYGDYEGCRTVEQKLKRFKELENRIKLSSLAKQDASTGGGIFLYEHPESGEYVWFEDLPDYVIDDTKKKFQVSATVEADMMLVIEAENAEEAKEKASAIPFQKWVDDGGGSTIYDVIEL